jgi:hypothetical protein
VLSELFEEHTRFKKKLGETALEFLIESLQYVGAFEVFMMQLIQTRQGPFMRESVGILGGAVIPRLRG